MDVQLLHGQPRMKRGERQNAVWHVEQLSEVNKSVYAAFCNVDGVKTQIVLLSRTDAKWQKNELSSFILVWKPSLRSTSSNATLNALCFLESFWRFKRFSNIKELRRAACKCVSPRVTTWEQLYWHSKMAVCLWLVHMCCSECWCALWFMSGRKVPHIMPVTCWHTKLWLRALPRLPSNCFSTGNIDASMHPILPSLTTSKHAN